MNGLSEAEREEITRLFGWVPESEPLEQMLDAVEAIVAARLASVKALADEWESLGDTDSAFWWSTLATHLRAALGSDAHTEPCDPDCGAEQHTTQEADK